MYCIRKRKNKARLSFCLIRANIMKTDTGEVWLHAFVRSAMDGGQWSALSPSRLTPRKIFPVHIRREISWDEEPVWTLWRRYGLHFRESISHLLGHSASITIITIPIYLFQISCTCMYLYNFYGSLTFNLHILFLVGCMKTWNGFKTSVGLRIRQASKWCYCQLGVVERKKIPVVDFQGWNIAKNRGH
jgi:hypothetical protein